MAEANKIRIMADEAAEAQARLREELKATTDPVEKKKLRSRIKVSRMLERWMRTRAGYR